MKAEAAFNLFLDERRMTMTRDMTKGNIRNHLLLYAVPLIFGDLFQQFYHTVDSIVVGRFYGKTALAAVGAAGPVMNILIFLIVGISLGASVLMAGYFGAKDYGALKEELSTSLTAGFYLTIVFSILSFAGSGLFIRLTRTPIEIAPEAAAYLRIVSVGLFFTFLYNILSAALRAVGNSKAPLCVLILTSLVNVALDIFLVGVMKMGVPGAAYATVISQAVSSLTLILYIYLKVPILRLRPGELHLNPAFLKQTVDFSSISALQQTMLYLGRLLVQAGVNTLGVDAVAAFNAASIIDSYVLAPGNSFASSVSTFSAQNKGGKEYDRILKGFSTTLKIAISYTLMVTFIILFAGRPLFEIFLKPSEQNAIALGLSYLRPMACFYFMAGMTHTFQGYFRGIGKLKFTLIGTLIQIPIRIALTYGFIGRIGLSAAAIGTTLGWLCMILFDIYAYKKYGKTFE